jgi:hypothetical protein
MMNCCSEDCLSKSNPNNANLTQFPLMASVPLYQNFIINDFLLPQVIFFFMFGMAVFIKYLQNRIFFAYVQNPLRKKKLYNTKQNVMLNFYF